jgi:uncharacterized repeat protein (TIGR03803 family)
VFRLTTSGQFTDLHDFQGTDGSQPAGALVEGTDGNLYGVTLYGGLSSDYGGTIFRVGLSGGFATVYEFNGNTGGTNPNAGMARGPGGNLYGMYKLGLGNPFPGPGGDYRIDHEGNITFPASFQSYPSAFAPVITSNGNIYALNQPSNFVGNGNETLEVIQPGSSEAGVVLNLPARFHGDVVNYEVGMIQGSDGLFYANGTSATADPKHPYVELQIDLAASQTNIFDLDGHGKIPLLSPLEGSDGKFYVVNGGGGTNGSGNVIALDYGLAPPAPGITAFYPTTAPAGTLVTILGAWFVNVKSVALNGRSVPFTAVSSGAIAFRIPATATTGPVTVTTANGVGGSADALTVR